MLLILKAESCQVSCKDISPQGRNCFHSCVLATHTLECPYCDTINYSMHCLLSTAEVHVVETVLWWFDFCYFLQFSSGLTDFYKVKSIRGTYITSVVKPAQSQIFSPQPCYCRLSCCLHVDNVLQSMISFDRGGRWQPLKPPPGECDGSPEVGVCIHTVVYSTLSVLFPCGLSLCLLVDSCCLFKLKSLEF